MTFEGLRAYLCSNHISIDNSRLRESQEYV